MIRRVWFNAVSGFVARLAHVDTRTWPGAVLRQPVGDLEPGSFRVNKEVPFGSVAWGLIQASQGEANPCGVVVICADEV